MRLVTNMLKYHQSETKQKKRQIVSTHMLIYNKRLFFRLVYYYIFIAFTFCVCIVFVCQNS